MKRVTRVFLTELMVIESWRQSKYFLELVIAMVNSDSEVDELQCHKLVELIQFYVGARPDLGKSVEEACEKYGEARARMFQSVTIVATWLNTCH